jgi:hypothetical protein
MLGRHLLSLRGNVLFPKGAGISKPLLARLVLGTSPYSHVCYAIAIAAGGTAAYRETTIVNCLRRFSTVVRRQHPGGDFCSEA